MTASPGEKNHEPVVLRHELDCRKEREIVIGVFPDYAAVRLLGTRTKYQVSWRAVFDLAAEIYVQRERQRKREEHRAAM